MCMYIHYPLGKKLDHHRRAVNPSFKRYTHFDPTLWVTTVLSKMSILQQTCLSRRKESILTYNLGKILRSFGSCALLVYMNIVYRTAHDFTALIIQ